MPNDDLAVAAELIHNTDSSNSKFVLSADTSLRWFDSDVEWFSYYTYTSNGFGQRADLSEDFLEVGHAVATQFSSGFSRLERLEWFVEVELYEDRHRIKLGLELSLN